MAELGWEEVEMTEKTSLPSDMLYRVSHPSLNTYQKNELGKLDKWADDWKEATELYACEYCPLLMSCREGWDIICEPKNTKAQKRLKEVYGRS